MKGEVAPSLKTAADNKKKPKGSVPVEVELDMKGAQVLRKRVVEHISTLSKLQKALKIK